MFTLGDYAPGNAGYEAVANQYGWAAANDVYAAAMSGDEATVNATLSDIRRNTTNADYAWGGAASEYGGFSDNLGSDSTWGNFGNQMATNPLSAPFDWLNGVLKNSLLSYLSNPMVLIVSVVVVWAVFFRKK